MVPPALDLRALRPDVSRGADPMTRYMTHIEFTDVYAKVPGSDDGVGATKPLGDDQRRGDACIDCESIVIGSTSRRVIGLTIDGPARVCLACYHERLRDHIDYYRPQS
jgi:hypothetical protein